MQGCTAGFWDEKIKGQKNGDNMGPLIVSLDLKNKPTRLRFGRPKPNLTGGEKSNIQDFSWLNKSHSTKKNCAPLQDPSCSFKASPHQKKAVFTQLFDTRPTGKQKQNRSIDSGRGQPVTLSFVQVLPQWTLVFFWSTSLGRRATYEVISCLFWSDLRDWPQMWRGAGEVRYFSWRDS